MRSCLCGVCVTCERACSATPAGGSTAATDENSVLQLKQLLFVATLGVGGFGRVVLVSGNSCKWHLAVRLDPGK